VVASGKADLMDNAGQGEIKLEREPYVPVGWQVLRTTSVETTLSVSAIRFYASKAQQQGRTILAADLAAELDWPLVLSAQALDGLLADPQVIPESWRGKAIAFWGTRYRDDTGEVAVRYLFWNGAAWDWYFHHLPDSLDAHCTAALHAPNE
jgi:hypothetical protein